MGTNCKTKFNGNGRLFEPKLNKNADVLVYKQAQKISKREGFWIGIRTQINIQSHGKKDFYYLSEGPSQSLNYNNVWDESEPDDAGGNEDCVSVLRFFQPSWADDDCDLKLFSICEPNVEEGCSGTFVNEKGREKEKPCIFPFKFKGKTYNQCTTDESENGKPRCAYRVNKQGKVRNGKWAECNRGCPGV